MKYERHCDRTRAILGKTFPQVHEWLDQIAWEGGAFNPHHRRYRHHAQGVEQVRIMWGDDAAKAAQRHILDDLFGPTAEDIALIPADEAEFVAGGY